MKDRDFSSANARFSREMLRPLSLMLAVISSFAYGSSSPEGLWQSFDSSGNRPEALIRITERDGVYTGVIEQILNPAEAGAICESCDGVRRNQPVEGMLIISDIRRNAEKEGVWDGGKLLDVRSGKEYRATMHLESDGSVLVTRGYIGNPMFGRSTEFKRVNEPL